MKALKLLFFVGLVFTAQFSSALVEIIETSEYSTIRDQILEDYSTQQSSDILIAFDIDETLLVVEECLSKKQSEGFSGWLNKVFQCEAVLTENEVDDYVAEFQSLGFATLALTARGANVLEPTERELTRNGLNFYGFPFTEKDNFEVPFTAKSSIVFKDGVTYSSGRNKGKVLQVLLSEFGGDFDQVIFIDDNIKNIRAMKKAYEHEKSVHVRIYHYTRYN